MTAVLRSDRSMAVEVKLRLGLAVAEARALWIRVP